MTQGNAEEALAKVIAIGSGKPSFVGTAFFVSATQLLTAKHVINTLKRDERLHIKGFVGHDSWPGKSQQHPDRDLALITIEPRDSHNSFIPVSTETITPESGDVDVYGFTTDSDKCDYRKRCLIQTTEYYDSLRFDNSIPKGFSGGPIVDQNQECIGVTYARLDDSNCSYGIPARVILDWLLEINLSLETPALKPKKNIAKPKLEHAEEKEIDQKKRSDRYICFMGREDILSRIDTKKTGNYGVALGVTYINKDWRDGFALRLQDYKGKCSNLTISADWPQRELGNIKLREAEFWKGLCQNSPVKIHQSDKQSIKNWVDTNVRAKEGRLVIQCDLFAHKDKNFPTPILSGCDAELMDAILDTWCAALGVSDPKSLNPLYNGRVILFFSIRLNARKCLLCTPQWLGLNRANNFLRVFQKKHLKLCFGLDLPELDDIELEKWKEALNGWCQLPGDYPQQMIELGNKILKEGKKMHSDFKFSIESENEYKKLLKETRPRVKL